MIILDISQVMISNIMVHLGKSKGEIEENMVRHMILNSIRANKKKFEGEYGQLVIACDNKDSEYWRKGFFPYYKANRKKNNEESKIDWQAIFKCLNKIREELKESFPYPIIDVPHAEADDVIGTLCKHFGKEEDYGLNLNNPILILSGDRDHIQCQTYSNVSQYDPVHKKLLKSKDPIEELRLKILKGDKGDGIPNILSDDNCLVIGKRQTPLSQKKIDSYTTIFEEETPHDYFERINKLQLSRNYIRNRTLIDYNCIPVEISENILKEYTNQLNKEKPKNLMNYFIKHRLRHLMTDLQDFV